MTSGGDAIAKFYEEHPYPPPVGDLDAIRRAWADGQRRRIEHHRLWPFLPFRDDHSILIAGCGTSQAAKYAVRYPRARVVGIDVSATSIDHTQSLVRQYQLSNVELHRLRVEDVEELGESFDHIVCTGVLHHLADPGVGLGALAKVLASGGAMQLMVYARWGRTGVYVIQEYCRRLGITPETVEIEDLVATLRELPPGHPISHLLRSTPDFADPDALADALLNPRDRAYSVDEVLNLVESAGLQFVRWTRQAPYLPECGVISRLPHGPRMAALPIDQQYAAMELFRGTMTRHSFITEAESGGRLDFDGAAWRRYVPIRTASSISVQEQLPPGAAAALLNRAHTDRDLVLFATPAEKRMFDLVDGSRTAGEISDATPGAGGEFFRKLWLSDLIVVDASDAGDNGRSSSE